MPAPIKVDRAEFLRLNGAGWTAARMAEHFGCSLNTISRLRKQFAVSPKPVMTEERKQAIAGMLADGWSHEEIQRTEGADVSTIRRHFPGTAWTAQQRAAHQAVLRAENPHFNRHPSLKLA